MPTAPGDKQPGQGELVVANFDTGQVTAENVSAEPYVDLEAARLHRLNILSLFAGMNQREIFYEYHQAKEPEPGKEAKRRAILHGIVNKRADLEQEAELEYIKSIGYDAAVEAVSLFPNFDYTTYRDAAKESWDAFRERYQGSGQSQERSEYRRQLLKGWAPTDIDRFFSRFDRGHDLRPFISPKDQKRLARRGKFYPLLDTRGRLLAIQDDARAGFLPKTNLEKNMVMTHLDYFDNPEYPLETVSQFFEVFIHQQTLDKPKPGDTPEKIAEKRARASARPVSGVHMGRRSLESITYEIGDFAQAARRSYVGLVALKESLQGIRPNLPVTEEIAPDDPGLRAVLQYLHLEKYRRLNVLPNHIEKPLVTRENRWRKEIERTDAHRGRNKIIEDVYTGSAQYATMAQMLAVAALEVTVQDVQAAIDPAIEDEARRERYHVRNLRSIAENAPKNNVLTVGDVAAEELARVA